MQRNELKAALYATYRRRLCGPDAYTLHDHYKFGELFWCDKGKCIHIINGEEVRLEAGDFVFIRPWDQHGFYGSRNRPFFLMVVCFSWHIYEFLKERYYQNDGSVYGEDSPMPRMLHLGKKQLQWARQTFFSLFAAPRSLLHIENYLGNVFLELGAVSHETDLNLASLPTWMHRGLWTIRRPEHFRLGAAELFRLCGRSPEHVSRVFRKATGESPSKYINRLRMKHAAALLSGTSQDILDIGFACGFESASHFYASFRNEYDTTPRAYRMREQQGHIISDDG